MIPIILAAIISYLFFMEVLVLMQRRLNSRALGYSIAYLCCVVFLAIVNFELEIFEQKFASRFSFDLYMGRESVLSNSAFLLQCLVNFPVFLITGHWEAAIGTNCALMATVFYVAFDRSPALASILVAPAIINFSMFALRDPIIGALAFLVTLEMANRKETVEGIVRQCCAGLLFLLIRPENIVIFGYSKLMIWMDRGKRQFLFYLAMPLIVVFMIGLAYSAPRLLGMESQSSITQLPTEADEFYQARATRNSTADGGGSNILGGRLSAMPLALRFPIQITTFFVLPLPHEIRGVAHLLAFVDSLFFMALCVYFHRHARRETIIIFWSYVLAVAFFSNNYGNVFRLRLPCYFVMLAGLMRR